MAKEQADVLISWYATNAEVNGLRSQFARPTRFIEMPAGPGTSYRQQIGDLGKNAIRAAIAKYLPNVEPLRVGLIGFSEGCQGVREALGCGDGPRVDAAFGIDGIHTEWRDPKTKLMDIALVRPWRAYARAAVTDGRLCVISTSAVMPPNTVATTYTSNWIWQQATGSDQVLTDEPLPAALTGPVEPPYVNPAGSFGAGQAKWKETVYEQYPIRLYRKANGLVIVNYSNLDATGVGDHRFQAARVSPLLLQTYLIPRWNQLDPNDPVCKRV